jgi:release factor glutamine methyltransferase
MFTVLEIIKRTTDFLAGKGIESPRLNAEHLIGHALGLPRMQLYLQFERPLAADELEKIRPLVRRRGQREPLQYVIGEADFYGLNLKADRRALIPRSETELLVELLSERLATTPPAAILDLGTGSGAIALALAKQFPEARTIGADKSAEALELARENGVRTALSDRVEWRESDWFGAIPAEAMFDLIVANPPYLSAEEVAEASPEIRSYEPIAALVGGGPDGLADLLAIVAGAAAHLRRGGMLAVETGIAQHERLIAHATDCGFARAESLQDLTGRDRFVIAVR